MIEESTAGKRPNTVSFSSLQRFSECPLQYYFCYIEKIPQIVSARLLLGRVFHATLEEHFNNKIKTSIDPPLRESLEIFESKFEEICKLPSIQNTEDRVTEVIDWNEVSKEELLLSGLKMTAKYLKEVAPFFLPTSIEEWLDLDIDYGTNVNRLVGRTDMRSHEKVIDFKVTKYVWPVDRINTSMQSFIYATLIGEPIDFEYHFLVANNDKSTTAIRRIHRSLDDIAWVMNDYLPKIVVEIANSNFAPHPGMRCTYCDYKEQCKFPL